MKIIADNQPRQYEVTYLVPAVYTDSELKAITQEFQELIAKHKGKILSTEDWGKRDLAYAIKKLGKTHHQAFYFHLLVELKPEKIQAFERDIHLMEEIIRHLVIVADEVKESESKKEAK